MHFPEIPEDSMDFQLAGAFLDAFAVTFRDCVDEVNPAIVEAYSQLAACLPLLHRIPVTHFSRQYLQLLLIWTETCVGANEASARLFLSRTLFQTDRALCAAVVIEKIIGIVMESCPKTLYATIFRWLLDSAPLNLCLFMKALVEKISSCMDVQQILLELKSRCRQFDTPGYGILVETKEHHHIAVHARLLLSYLGR